MSKDKSLIPCYYRDRILEEFRFEQVHAVMEELEWEWSDIDRVPTVEDLRCVAYDIMSECISHWVDNDKKFNMSAGGLYASISKKGKLSLRFSIEELSTADIEESDEICDNDEYIDEDDCDIDPEVKEVYYDEDDEYFVDDTEE